MSSDNVNNNNHKENRISALKCQPEVTAATGTGRKWASDKRRRKTDHFHHFHTSRLSVESLSGAGRSRDRLMNEPFRLEVDNGDAIITHQRRRSRGKQNKKYSVLTPNTVSFGTLRGANQKSSRASFTLWLFQGNAHGRTDGRTDGENKQTNCARAAHAATWHQIATDQITEWRKAAISVSLLWYQWEMRFALRQILPSEAEPHGRAAITAVGQLTPVTRIAALKTQRGRSSSLVPRN